VILSRTLRSVTGDDVTARLRQAAWQAEQPTALARLDRVEELALRLLEEQVPDADRWAARADAVALAVVADYGFLAEARALGDAAELLGEPRPLGSEDGRTLARLLLPARRALDGPPPGGAATAPDGAVAAPVPELGRSVDVVVVEDDAMLVPLLQHSLEAQGLTVLILSDGPAAVRALTGSAALHARLVLLDVDLPGSSGLEVLRRLKAANVLTETNVIMLTARSTEAEVLDALELGAVDHVAKPFSLAVLMHRIRLALSTNA
jgi:CheY-like chemotaxis protein